MPSNDPDFNKVLQDAARSLLANVAGGGGSEEIDPNHPNVAASKYVYSRSITHKTKGKHQKKALADARRKAAEKTLASLSLQALNDTRERRDQPDVSTTAIWNRLGDYGNLLNDNRGHGSTASAGGKRGRQYAEGFASGMPSPESALDPRRVPVNQGPPPRDFYMQGFADQSLAELGAKLRSQGQTQFDLQGYRGDLESQPGVSHLRMPEGSNPDVGSISVRAGSGHQADGQGSTQHKNQDVMTTGWPVGRPDKSALRHELRHAIDMRAPEKGRDSATDYSPFVYSTQGGIQREVYGSNYHRSIPELRAEEVEKFRAWMRTRKVAPDSDLGMYNAIHMYLNSQDFTRARPDGEVERKKTAESFLNAAAKYFAASPKDKKKAGGRSSAKLISTR